MLTNSPSRRVKTEAPNHHAARPEGKPANPAMTPTRMSASMSLRAYLAAMPPDAVFTSPEATLYCGVGGSTWERMRARGETPEAIRLTGRTLGYRKRSLDAMLQARMESRAA